MHSLHSALFLPPKSPPSKHTDSTKPACHMFPQPLSSLTGEKGTLSSREKGEGRAVVKPQRRIDQMHPHCFKSNKGGRSSCHPSSSPHSLPAPNSLAPMTSAAAVLAGGGGCLFCLDPLNPQEGKIPASEGKYFVSWGWIFGIKV
ncbi:unnamed protein product [Natator depressus]